MLSSLTNLDLDRNPITDTIPSEIGMLSSLTRLILYDNSITGMIPSEIGMSAILFSDLNDEKSDANPKTPSTIRTAYFLVALSMVELGVVHTKSTASVNQVY